MLRHALLTVLLISLTSSASYAQTSFPAGLYLTKKELLNKTPSMPYMLTRSSSADGFVNSFKAPAKEVKRKTINKKIWAISDGSNLYLNGYKIEFDFVYYKVEHEGKYLLYQGGIPAGDAAAIAFGGGIVAAAVASQSRWLYAWNPETEENFKLNKDILTKWLEKTPELQQEYQAESFPKDMDVIIRYASLRNEAYEQESPASNQ